MWDLILVQSNTMVFDDIIFAKTYRYTYHSPSKTLLNLSQNMRLPDDESPYQLGIMGGELNQMGGGQTGYFNKVVATWMGEV